MWRVVRLSYCQRPCNERPFSLPRGVQRNTGLRRRLLDALETLSVPQREVVLLHDLEGWTHAEIAAALELSEVNCRQHLFTARRALRRQLAALEPEALHG